MFVPRAQLRDNCEISMHHHSIVVGKKTAFQLPRLRRRLQLYPILKFSSVSVGSGDGTDKSHFNLMFFNVGRGNVLVSVRSGINDFSNESQLLARLL